MRTTNRLARPLASLAFLALLQTSVARAEDHRALGKEAFGRADYAAAVEQFLAASRELEGVDREALAQVQIDLGITYLSGLDRPADALRAFVRAADLASNPASAWLWASTAALQMGDEAESDRYKHLALGVKRTPVAANEPPPAAVGQAPSAPVPAQEQAAPVSPAPPTVAPSPAPAPTKPVLVNTEPAKAIEMKSAETESAPAPRKTREKKAPQKDGAFAHFFGAKTADSPQENERETVQEAKPAPEATSETPAARAEKAPAGSSGKKASEKREEASAAKKPEAPAPPASGAAFDHFFKRKPGTETTQPEPEPAGEPATADEPPPSGGAAPY